MRIVSLLPSATDIVVALGAADEVVGVSHSCGPEWSHVPRLTRTWIDTQRGSAEIDAQVRGATRPLYELNIEQLEALAPDVIVSQSLCKVCAIPAGDVEAAIRALPTRPDVVDLSPSRLDDVPLDFAIVAEALERKEAGRALQHAWRSCFDRYHLRYESAALSIAFLDWLDPAFAAGHWVPDMIEWLGAKSVLARPGEPSYETTWKEVVAAKPDLVVAACCGYDQSRAAQESTDSPCEIVFLDGYRHFNRPSPMLMESVELLDAVVAEFLGV